MTKETDIEQDLSERRRSFPADLASIMVRPRTTFRRILDRDPDRYVWLVVFLVVVSSFFRDFNLKGLEDLPDSFGPATLLGIAILALLVVCILTIGFFLVISLSAWAVGKWMEGTGTFKDVRSAIAWGAAPLVWQMVYLIPSVAYAIWRGLEGYAVGPPTLILDDTRFQMTGGSLSTMSVTWMVALLLLDTVFSLWWIILTSHTVGEAHRFSSWKGFGTLVLSVILPVATIASLAFVTWLYFQRLG